MIPPDKLQFNAPQRRRLRAPSPRPLFPLHLEIIPKLTSPPDSNGNRVLPSISDPSVGAANNFYLYLRREPPPGSPLN